VCTEHCDCDNAAFIDEWRRAEIMPDNTASLVQTRSMRNVVHEGLADMVMAGAIFVVAKPANMGGDGHDFWLCRALETVVQLDADEVDAHGTKSLAGYWVLRAHFLEWADKDLGRYRVDTARVVNIESHLVRLANVVMTEVRCGRRNTLFKLGAGEADPCLEIAGYT
jgi:hypothetical protein